MRKFLLGILIAAVLAVSSPVWAQGVGFNACAESALEQKWDPMIPTQNIMLGIMQDCGDLAKLELQALGFEHMDNELELKRAIAFMSTFAYANWAGQQMVILVQMLNDLSMQCESLAPPERETLYIEGAVSQ